MVSWGGLTPPYATIVADPPWRYRSSNVTTKGAAGYHPSHRKPTAEQHYTTMSNEELLALPVRDLAADNAHLYLWTTNPRLFGDRKRSEPSPIEIMEAWGFNYVTLLTWVKQGTLGMGFYFRGETEHLLFGVRGHAPIPPNKRERNIITAAKHTHSAKPAALYDLVERVSAGPYVELFARQPRLGWDSWGFGHENFKAQPECAS